MKKNNVTSSTPRVSGSIPNNVNKMIQDIKEITNNHSEEDIYAMLKDCSMDPNETTQRLLLLDTFHEVKRKRDKKKEALKSKSGEESRWKSGHQGRGTRTSRGNSFSQYSSNGAGGWRTAAIRKENGVVESKEKGPWHSHALLSKETDSVQLRDREKLSSIITNGPLELQNGSLKGGHGMQLSKMPEAHLSEKKVDASAENASSIVPKVSEESAPSASYPVLIPPRDSWASTVSIKQKVPVQQIAEMISFGNTEFVRENHLNHHEVENVDNSRLSSLESEKQLCELVNVGHSKILDDCPVVDKSQGLENVTVVKPSSPQGLRDATAKIEKMKFSDGQHVIIPQHIQVPDAVKNVLNFGSLDASFGGRESCVKNESIEASNYVVNSAHEETPTKFNSCDQDDVSTASPANHADHPQSPFHLPGQNSPVDTNVTSNVASSDTVPEYGRPKQDNLPVVGPPFPVVQPSPSYSFGFMPPMLANVLARPEGVESQTHAVSSLGEASVSTSTSTPPPIGAGQSSVGAFPQPIHVFRQHYPPNYIPYGHYISPFYVPPTMHQYFGHTAFPAPIPTASMYIPPPTTSPGMKVPPSNFKPGTHTGNQAPLGVPSVYGTYGTTPVGYIQNGTVTSGNSSSGEDLGPSALKDSTNIYLGHQNEGSAMWLPTTGARESASFPVNSFINLPPHGQHHMLNPQSGHGGFAVYHTLQPMGNPGPAPGLPLLQQSQPVAGSVDSVGPPSNSYQQPINWNM